ncbi:MAG: hypothetical protein ISR27_06880 [Pseudomonadales bacterium]|nr:hypothetical protein [Pseudomonadales bacterium]
MLISLSEAVRRLKCGKAKLYRILAELEIQPTLKGTSKLISEEDFLRIKEAFEVDGPYPSGDTPYQTPTATTAQQSPKQRNNNGTTAENAVVEGLQAQIDLLKGQVTQLSGLLENEQSERKAERSERETYQQLLGALQQNNQKLLQENNRLQLEMLDSPARQDVHFEPRKEEESSTVTPEVFEAEDIPPETIANRNSRSGSRAFGVGLSVAAIIGVLFYAAITQGGDWLSGSLERGISAALKVNGTEPDTR